MTSVGQTVVETSAFISAAKGCLTAEERAAFIDRIASDPLCGSLVKGGGGIRKVRIAIGGRGKRGGARVIYYYHDPTVPIFLLTVFAKNERADLSPAERSSLAKVAKLLATTYGDHR